MVDSTQEQTSTDESARIELRKYERAQRVRTTVRRSLVFVIFVTILGLLYTGYKVAGQSIDDAQRDWPVIGSVLPATNDLIMPPISAIISEFNDPPQRRNPKTLGGFIFDAALFTAREAFFGFVAGVVLGFGLAVLMLRSRTIERGLMPYVVVSQTVPLVAIAPIIVIWGQTNFGWLPFTWNAWMSVSIIATYLTFFPVAVNGLKGLQSPSAEAVELMESYASSRTQTLLKLRLPAAVPYLFAAFKLAASASIVGAIVGEISSGVGGGIGRLILDFASRYTTGPERLYASVAGAAALGIVVFGLISLLERHVVGGTARETSIS
ncbi:MAG: ABC transporter permease subunit [Acidobacteria bacterium]|nr:ABC transporter permease subunit [Acidobacteriota bacterium]